ncbi:MAG: malate synthase G, partial [Pseudomonadota bacterium]
MAYREVAGLEVEETLHAFLEEAALPGSGVDPAAFWEELAGLIRDFAPENAALLARRAELQAAIDAWHRARSGQVHDAGAYAAFLREIGYLEDEGPDFEIETSGTDPEIAAIPGPQLVVPVMNARYALNAANARWGSLYDALYGTDALGDGPLSGPYDPARGARVIAWAKAFLDDVLPLAGASHADVTGWRVAGGALVAETGGGAVPLADPAAFAGYRGEAEAPAAILLRRHGLHVELVIDAGSAIGGSDPAGLSDVLLEAAVSTIMDCEDSVAAVDGPDKALAYANWLGLMQGTLTEEVAKGGRVFTRALAPDRDYTAPGGGAQTLKGRSLMLV